MHIPSAVCVWLCTRREAETDNESPLYHPECTSIYSQVERGKKEFDMRKQKEEEEESALILPNVSPITKPQNCTGENTPGGKIL